MTSKISEVRKKLSMEYYRILTLYHEAGHAIFGLLNSMKITSVQISDDQNVGAYTHYNSLELDKIKDPYLLFFAVELEIGMRYAGLAAEKIYYKKMCGSDNLPFCLKEGSGDDNSEALRLIKTFNIVPPGKKRSLYKKRTVKKVSLLLSEYWEEITLLAHALHKRKRIYYPEIKKILLKSSRKNFWKIQFQQIEDLYSSESPEEHITI